MLEIHKQHNSLGLRIVGGVETQLVSENVLPGCLNGLGLGEVLHESH